MGNWLPRSSTPDPRNHPGFNIGSPAPSPAYVRAIMDNLKPVDIHLDHYYLHDERFQYIMAQLNDFHHPEATHAPKSAISMNWTRHVAISMKQLHEHRLGQKYDRVICTRWDIDHTLPINITQFDPNVLTFAKGGGDHPGDTWACGTSDLMDAWGAQFDGIPELVANRTMNLGPHEWQTAWFDHKQIPWANRADIGASVLR